MAMITDAVRVSTLGYRLETIINYNTFLATDEIASRLRSTAVDGVENRGIPDNLNDYSIIRIIIRDSAVNIR